MKRKLFLIHVAALLMMLAIPVTGTALNQVSFTATYDNSLLSFGTDTVGGVTYTTVDYSGLINVGTPGMPSLPVEFLHFSVPYNATNFTVSATPTVGQTSLLSHPVYPLQSKSGFTQPDASVYQNCNPYPGESAWVVNDNMIAGENHVVTVAVLPWIYLHTVGATIPDTLRIAGTVSITLFYELASTPAISPLVRKGASLRNEGYEMTESMVVNPDDVRNNAISHSSNMINSDLHPSDSVVNPLTYLIISMPEFVHPMRRVAALKMQKGINVKILTVQEAMNDSMAVVCDPEEEWEVYYFHRFCDAAEKIRNNLRAYYAEHGTEYVLLAGSDIPFREGCAGDTDHYYCDLTGFWDNEPGYGLELRVGRLMGSQPRQFDNYTDKLFRYELNPGNGDYEYLNREISMNYSGISSRWTGDENQIPSNTVGMLFEDSVGMTGREVIETIRDNHYGISRGYQNGMPSGIPLTVYGEQVCDTTHCVWAIDTVKVSPIIIDYETGNGFNCLDNKDYPMIFTTFDGVTMPYRLFTGYNIDINCGESFTMGKDYGGPAYIGTTGDVYNEKMFMFEETCIENLRRYPIGEALTRTKRGFSTYYNDDFYCCYNLLGDPSMRQWPVIPQQYSGITVSRSDNSVTINGINSPNTTIGYHSNDGTTGSHKTSASSITLNNVSPNSTIMLYKQDHIPYIAPLVLQNTDLDRSQYVIANEVIAGRSVDNGRTNGNVTVKNGAEYEIEASGKVTLSGGFKVERGAYFTVQKATFK